MKYIGLLQLYLLDVSYAFSQFLNDVRHQDVFSHLLYKHLGQELHFMRQKKKCFRNSCFSDILNYTNGLEKLEK